MSRSDIEQNLDGFFSAEYLHWSFDEDELQNAPSHVRETYVDIRSRAGPWE